MVTWCWIFILRKRSARAGWPAWVVLPYLALVVAPACWLWHQLFPSNEMLAMVVSTVPLELLKANSFANVCARAKQWLAANS